MRILQVAQTHPPEWSGGSTFLTVMLCRKLVQSGVTVHYLCGTSNQGVKPYEMVTEPGEGYPVTKIGLARKTNGFSHLFRIRNMFRTFLSEHEFDLIHIHSTRGIGEGLILAARERRIPIIVRLTDGSWLCTNLFFINNTTGTLCTGSGIIKCSACQLARLKKVRIINWPKEFARLLRNVGWTLFVRRRILTTVDHIVATCRFLVTQFSMFGFPRTLDIIRNRVDEEEIRRKKPRKIRSPVIFGALGVFRPNKGGDLLLEAVSKLPDLYNRMELHIWGHPDRATIEKYGRILESSPIKIHGRYSRTDLSSIFSKIDMLIHTSLWDTLPIVVLESLASGTPVLTSDSHGMKEVVKNNESGILFEPGSADSLARCIRSLVQDPARLQAIQDGIPEPEPFDVMVDEYMKLYSITLDRRSQKKPEANTA